MKKACAYFSNGLGNFVMLSPAIQALRDMTGSPVDIVIPDGWHDPRRKPVEEIVEAWDVTGKVIHPPKDPMPEYDAWLYSRHHADHSMAHLFIDRCGYPPPPVPAWKKTMDHEVDYYMGIVRGMGYEGPTPKIGFPTSADPVLDLPRPIIGLCNGAFATKVWLKKRWPRFHELARVMKAYFGGSIVGIGGKDELTGVPMDEDFTGRLPILQTAKVLSQLDLFVTTDTGCMHIADALDVNLIALFGGTITSKNGPRGKNSRVIASDIDCAPCQYLAPFHSCEIYACMDQIRTGDVMVEARRILS